MFTHLSEFMHLLKFAHRSDWRLDYAQDMAQTTRIS